MENMTAVEHLRVVQGHAGSINQQLEELNKFILEISAISNYGERGMVSINMQPILMEINNRLTSIGQSVNVILDEAKELPDLGNHTQNQ